MPNFELVFPYSILFYTNFYATLNDLYYCALTTVIMLVACSKWGKRE